MVSSAAAARQMLVSERQRTLDLLASTDLGRAAIDEFNAHKPSSAAFAGIGRLDEPGSAQLLIERGLRSCFDAVTKLIEDRSLVKDVEVVAVDSDTTSASTRSFPDGSHLIMVSDALMSLLQTLGELIVVWSKSKGRFRLFSTVRRVREYDMRDDLASTDPVIIGGAATLRYFILHQRAWATSAHVGTTLSLRDKLHAPELSLVSSALLFVLAHEVGHVALRHSRIACEVPADEQARELEADLFAFEVLHRMTNNADAAYASAVLALSAIAITTGPLFIRAPETHPPVADRIANLFNHHPQGLQFAKAYWGFIEMVTGAIAVEQPLDQRCWEAMISQKEFDTRHHRREYFTLIRGFDNCININPKGARDLILSQDDMPESMRKNFDRIDRSAVEECLMNLQSGHIDSALYALGVQRTQKLLDPMVPLSFHSMVSALSTCAALGFDGELDVPAPLDIKVPAMLLTTCATPLLRRNRRSKDG